MIYLADVNVLIALAWPHHTSHQAARTWWRTLAADDVLATCAMTEIGFVRISLRPGVAIATIAQAQAALAQLRQSAPLHRFLNSELGAAALPSWVKTPAATTDGYLAALANHHGARFVTFDTAIPGAVHP